MPVDTTRPTNGRQRPSESVTAGRGHPVMVTTRASVLAEAEMEIASLRAESLVDARHMADPANRLRESAIRDGRFNDFADASALCHRIERMARRGR